MSSQAVLDAPPMHTWPRDAVAEVLKNQQFTQAGASDVEKQMFSPARHNVDVVHRERVCGGSRRVESKQRGVCAIHWHGCALTLGVDGNLSGIEKKDKERDLKYKPKVFRSAFFGKRRPIGMHRHLFAPVN